MASKVQATMSTEVALDLVQASTAIKNLTSAVSSANSAWKAQEAYLRSTGDYAGAAKARYEGLGSAIDAQKQKINALEEKQRSLNNVDQATAEKYLSLKKQIQEAREEMSKLDTSTDEGKAKQKELQRTIDSLVSAQKKLDVGTTDAAREYLNYGRQVDQAKAKLASMQAQQRRAAQAVELEDSGIKKLSNSMRAQDGLAQATVERLRSQGQTYQALQVQLNATRQRLASLQQIQNREISLLATTKQRFGETSDEYAKQATRVQKLGTQINETSQKVGQLNTQMRKTPTGWLGRVNSRLDEMQPKAERVSGTFGHLFGATAAANLFTNALSGIGGQLTSLIGAGAEYDITQNKMVATWTTLTGSASKAGPMIDSINKMSQATGQNVDVVNELEQGFYHLNSNKKQADSMTGSLLNMADAVGLNGEQIQAVEQDMVHGMATGKITQGELNQIGQYFPMIDEAMAKHFHTTVAGMRQMAKAGKISAKDLQDVFTSLGNGKYKAAAENMMNSYFGVFRTIRARTPQLIGDIEKPFMKMSNPLLKQTRNWVNDKRTDALFTRFGQHSAQALNQVIKAFGGSKLNFTKVFNDGLKEATNAVDALGNVVKKHHTEIANFFKAFKTGSTAQIKLFANVMLDLSRVMLPVLDTMAKFPKTSAALITGFLLANKAIRGLSAAVNGLQTLKMAGEMIRTFSTKVRSIPSRKVTKIQVNGANSTKDLQKFSDSVDRVPSKKTTTVSANTTNAQRNLNAVQHHVQQVPNKVTVKATANTAEATANLTKMGTTAVSTGTKTMSSMSLIAKGAGIARTGLALIGGPAGAAMLAVQGLQLLYNSSPKFQKFVNGIASGAAKAGKSMINGIGNGVRKSIAFVKNNWKSIGLYILNPVAGALNSLYKHNSKFRTWVNGLNSTAKRGFRNITSSARSMASQVGRHISTMWRNATRQWRNGTNQTNRLTRSQVRQEIAQHRTMSTQIARFNSQMWKRARSTFNAGWNTLRRSTHQGSRNVTNDFGTMRITIAKHANEAMKNAGSRFKIGFNTMLRDTQNWRGQTSNTWLATGNDIRNSANNTSNNANNITKNMHSNLWNTTRNGLSTMLKGWQDHFSGLENSIESAVSPVANNFRSVMNGIARPFSSIVNGIAKGVNWIIDKVGGDGHLGTGFTMNFANGTPGGGLLHDQVAMLNDGNGPHYQEMIHTPEGNTMLLPPQRNIVLPLKAGTEILDGERTHQLVSAFRNRPVPHANGAIGSFFSGIWNDLKDGAEDAFDWVDKALKNVVEFGTETFNHFIEKMSGPKDNGKFFSVNIHHHVPHYVATSIQAWLKKQLEAMQDDNGNAATPAMIRKAAARMGIHDLPDSFVNDLMQVIQNESGNRSVMQQIHDMNSGGNEAGGILQYTPGTFMAYAMPGHTNRMKPFDELLAFFNNSDWRNSIGWTTIWGHRKMEWLHSGPQGHRRLSHFANGGVATVPSIFGEAGAEMAIPLDTMKSSRAWQLMRQVVDYYAGTDAGNKTTVNPTDTVPIERRLDAVLQQNAQLIRLMGELIGVTDSANNPTKRYRRTARDVNLAHAQSLTY